MEPEKAEDFFEIEKKVRECREKILKNERLSSEEKRRLLGDLDNLLGLYANALELGKPVEWYPNITIYTGFAKGFDKEVKKQIEYKLSQLNCLNKNK